MLTPTSMESTTTTPYTAAADNDEHNDTASPADDSTRTTEEQLPLLTIRWSMAWISCWLSVAAVGTALLAQRFRLVLLLCWFLVWILWMGLAWVLQESSSTQRQRLFPDHAAAGWFRRQVDAVAHDCRDAAATWSLLLTNGDLTEAPKQRPARTLLFRAVVQPMLLRPLARVWRHRKRRHRKQDTTSRNDPAEAELV